MYTRATDDIPSKPDRRLESVEELDDLAVLATKRVEAYLSRH